MERRGSDKAIVTNKKPPLRWQGRFWRVPPKRGRLRPCAGQVELSSFCSALFSGRSLRRAQATLGAAGLRGAEASARGLREPEFAENNPLRRLGALLACAAEEGKAKALRRGRLNDLLSAARFFRVEACGGKHRRCGPPRGEGFGPPGSESRNDDRKQNVLLGRRFCHAYCRIGTQPAGHACGP